MRSLCIDVDRLSYAQPEYLQAKQRLANALYHLQYVQSGLFAVDYWLGIKAYALLNDTKRLCNTLDAVNYYIIQSAGAYRVLEMQLNKSAAAITNQNAQNITGDVIRYLNEALRQMKRFTVPEKAQKTKDLTNKVTVDSLSRNKLISSLKSALIGKAETAKQKNYSLDFLDGHIETTKQGFKNRSLKSLLTEGIKYSAEGTLHLVNASAIKSFGQSGHLSASAGVGNAEVSGSVKGMLFDSKGFQPTLTAEGEAIVSAVQAKAVSVFKNDIIKNTFKAQIDVGVAEASGKAVFSKDEVTLEGDVGVSAVKAKAENSFEILGLTFTVGGSTEVGLGVGGGYSLTNRSLSFSGRIACLFGIGAEVKIEW